MRCSFIFFAALALSGCGIGGMWMNGNPFYGREPYIPPRDYWVEEGRVDVSKRANDWIECGGDPQGGGTAWKNLPDNEKEIFLYRKKYFKDIQRCMLRKGYIYTGVCHEFNADYPACGAS